MKDKCRKSYLIIVVALCINTTFFAGLLVNCYANSFTDNFDDGVIDSTFWSVSGDGVSESAGTLNLARNNAIDSFSSINSFSGLFDITFDITLDNIVWNDMFHGISLMESAVGGTMFSNGISFGFSKYNMFYSAQNRTTQVSFYYGLNFSTGTSYSFRLTNDINNIYLYVDDSLMFTRDFSYVNNFYIHFPGMYEDGDGSGIGDSNTTSSRIDNFSITTVPTIPDPTAAFLLGSACLVGFGGVRRKFKR